jgi:hypothetical protein
VVTDISEHISYAVVFELDEEVCRVADTLDQGDYLRNVPEQKQLILEYDAKLRKHLELFRV